MRDTNGPLPDTAFWKAYGGKFKGVPTWEGFDKFWPVLAESGGEWFVFDPTQDAPQAPIPDISDVLAEARECVEAVRKNRSFCGTIFADDLAAPTFVKIFDPWKMGASCGSSGERILPRWILSRIAPTALQHSDPSG